MSNKQELVDILKAKFKLIVEGSGKAEDVKQTDDGNTLSLYNVGVIDISSAGEFVGRRVRFYVINEGHPQEIMTVNEAGESVGTGDFTAKTEEASWLGGETPKTILEIEAEEAAKDTKEKRLQVELAKIYAEDPDPAFLGLEDNGELKVVKMEINGDPRALSFLGNTLVNLRDKSKVAI